MLSTLQRISLLMKFACSTNSLASNQQPASISTNGLPVAVLPIDTKEHKYNPRCRDSWPSMLKDLSLRFLYRFFNWKCNPQASLLPRTTLEASTSIFLSLLIQRYRLCIAQWCHSSISNDDARIPGNNWLKKPISDNIWFPRSKIWSLRSKFCYFPMTALEKRPMMLLG